MDRIECVVVGAGVVGLAVARALAAAGREVIVLESESIVGSGVSSRNSCVIHAGLYYPNGSNRARLCVAGKHAMYRFCAEHGVSHARVGKLVVATDEAQIPAMRALADRARGNGVDDLEFLTPARVREIEPAVRCVGALLSPSTGIVDAHEYMLELQGGAEAHGAMVAFDSPCVGGAVTDRGLRVDVGGADPITIECDLLVNSAGLSAQAVAASIEGLAPETIPALHYAKGNYFTLTGRSPFTRLIYPMPDGAWLGVHVGLDLAGRCKFGPDLHWVDDLDYDVDPASLPGFYASIRRYWPDLPDGALAPDFAGIRPKIYGPGEPAPDFLVQTRAGHGVKGLVNLYGIESPGLTSAFAIGEHVAAIAGEDA